MDRLAKIMVTGGAGFLGTCVVKALRDEGYSDIFVPRSREYDLREQEAARRLMTDMRADVVIHAAAVVGGIGANAANPGRFFYDNLMMGAILLEEARKAAVKKFITLGTICSYPKFAPVPFCEQDLWQGFPEDTNAPYGIAKKALLVQGHAYRKQYGLNVIYLMPVNLYGPGDNFDPGSSHVIPSLIRKFSEALDSGSKEVVLWGDGSATREFLYVKDAARAIVLAMQRYDEPDPINLGSGSEISIRDLAEKISGLLGYRGRITWDTSKPNGQPRRRLDVSRAQQKLGFTSKVGLDEGLKNTVDWYEHQRRLVGLTGGARQ